MTMRNAAEGIPYRQFHNSAVGREGEAPAEPQASFGCQL